MSDKWHGGKGSRYRKIDQKSYNDNWERIFGKNKEEDKNKKLKKPEMEKKDD